MTFHNPKYRHRHSIRLKGYDYSQEGLYFITMCCQDRACLFGHIVNGTMVLNNAGQMAQQCWQAIPEHFPNVVLHEYVIMPNHVHGIIEIVTTVGASVGVNVGAIVGAYVRAKNISPLPPPVRDNGMPNGTSKTIGSMVRGFKIGVTKWMRQNTDIHHVWQRNYYEHIIRNEPSYNRISNYILNNPANWNNDKFYTT